MTIKALLAATALAATTLSLPAVAAELTVGFSQIGSESGWRAAETTVSKSEAAKRKRQPQDRRRAAEAGEPDQGDPLLRRAGRRRDLPRAGGVDGLGCGAQGSQGSQDPGDPARSRHRSVGQGPLSDRRHLGQRAGRRGRRRMAGQDGRRQGLQRRRAAGHRRRQRREPTARRASTPSSPSTPTSSWCAARPATSPAPRARK